LAPLSSWLKKINDEAQFASLIEEAEAIFANADEVIAKFAEEALV